MVICLYCQYVKAKCKNPGDLLQPILILEWKFKVISMDFITILLRTMRQHDSIMVMVNGLSNVAHFIPMNATYSSSEVAHVFIREIMRLHGVLKNIVENKDANFTAKFWKELFAGLGTKLALSTTYHLQTNG